MRRTSTSEPEFQSDIRSPIPLLATAQQLAAIHAKARERDAPDPIQIEVCPGPLRNDDRFHVNTVGDLARALFN